MPAAVVQSVAAQLGMIDDTRAPAALPPTHSLVVRQDIAVIGA